MLSADEFIRFVSLVVYVGFIVSSITGFVESGNVPSNEHSITIITTSLVVFIQNIVYFIIETMKLYEKNQFINNYLYYVRAILLIESAILCIGLTSVGVGFGIFGIIMFLINMLAGVFLTDNKIVKVAPFSNIDDSNYENPQNLD